MKFNLNKHLPNSNMRGAALVMGLMILLVMTMIGVTAMESSSLEERMAGNSRDVSVAFQAAEAALSDAENYTENTLKHSHFSDDTQYGLYDTESDNIANIWDNIDWSASGTTKDVSSSISGAQADPTYILEYLELSKDIDELDPNDTGTPISHVVRITARGIGASENTTVLVQSTIGVHPNKL